MSNDGTVELVVEWKKRQDGYTPMNSVITNHDLKNHFPLLLIQFYESKIKATN